LASARASAILVLAMSSGSSDAPVTSTLSFPCSNCGAKLGFDPHTQRLACPYCGHQQAVLEGGAGAAAPPMLGPGIPLERGLELAERGLGAQVTTVQCRDCGATVNVGQGERTASCAFCGSKSVLSLETNAEAIRPGGVVPFRIAKDEANRLFGTWLAGLWFRPSDLKRAASVQEMGGVYVPFWSFSADVWSRWTAERGHYYYIEERYTENGVERTRRIQKIRWEPASGARQDVYTDVLVCAGRGLPEDLVERVAAFDVNRVGAYRPEYLAGWRAEAYAVDLAPGWQDGQSKMARSQEQRCARDVGGDTQRSLSVESQFRNVTFKHLLLPIWIAAYRYRGKVFRFLVNGQTGEVVGRAPWSFWKLFLLTVMIAAIVIGIVLLTRNR
jgi:DNA-directed RNA polymerase subunit RPC12/RpoP